MQVGDWVRLILDKEGGPDNWWLGETGTITRILNVAAGDVTGDQPDSLLCEVELDDGEEQPNVHFRYQDLVLLKEHERALRE